MNQKVLQHDDVVVAPITDDLGMQAFDRRQRPLDDLGKKFSIRQQCAGDVVHRILGAAPVEDAVNVTLKPNLIFAISRMATVNKLHDVKVRVHCFKPCHLCQSRGK